MFSSYDVCRIQNSIPYNYLYATNHTIIPKKLFLFIIRIFYRLFTIPRLAKLHPLGYTLHCGVKGAVVMKKIISARKEIFSIPNIMSYLRIILIPVFMVLYLRADSTSDYLIAAAVMGVSALTDLFDGKIARRFNMITELGKILDPVADKLTHAAIAIALSFRYPLMRTLIAVFIIKELFMGTMGLIMMTKGKRMNGAQWYGKLCTAVLFAVLFILLLYADIPCVAANILIILCMAVMILSLICYIVFYIRMAKGIPNEKNIIKVKYPVLALVAFVVIFAIYDAVCVIVRYRKQPDVSDKFINNFSVNDFYSDSLCNERACVISDNGQALFERIRLINQAKERIIMSTFDFHDDESGMVMMGALISAADRGVDVRIIADGMDSWISMEGNPHFYALAAHPNIELRIYNKVNPLTPWKMMGRLHDKYLIADNSVYILGGRNTFNYFLGDYPGHKNYDRDVLVFNENAPEISDSLGQLLDYFEQVWNYKESRAFQNKASHLKWSSVKKGLAEIERCYTEYLREKGGVLEPVDYTSITMPTNKITLIYNPTDYGPKEPTVFYSLTELMKNADYEVKIHTPYIICNEMMYSALDDIVRGDNSPDSERNVWLMTNSVARNGNPFGAGEYAAHKDRILDTGINVLEYEGEYSYHGKSITIDDDIAIAGSFNMDMRSVYLNTELMLVIDSEPVNRQLKDDMEKYEKDTRQALPDGTYLNPNNIEPVEITPKRRFKMNIVEKLFGWARFLF